jgi:hypothetical protein
MGFDPNAGTRSRSGAAAWAGPNRAFPRDGGARVDPPRGPSRARVDADAEARSKYAKKATKKAKDAPDAPEAEPVLIETVAPGFENQGVAKTDVVVDEDGDAANDFLLADPDPAEREINLAARKKNPNKNGGGCFCASCGLDVSSQPDVPLPPLKKEDPPRPETEVGRWLGRCEGGCEVALCGPCATAMTTPALAAATTKLEAVISGLGTGYTELGEDDDPEGADARDPPVRCPRVVLKKGRNSKGAKRCASRLTAPPLAEAEKETYQIWATAATEALFAARDSRMFHGDDAGGAGTLSAEQPTPMDEDGDPVDENADENADENQNRSAPFAEDADASARESYGDKNGAGAERAPRFAICPNFSCAARVLLEPASSTLPAAADRLVAERDPTTGRWLSREALIHRHTKKFRCARCATDFCGDCLVTPYHVGFHLCAAAAAAAAAPRCRYCDAPHLDPGTHYFKSADTHLRGVSGDASVREIRRAIGNVDVDWCVTKDDLRSVYCLASSVCHRLACRKKVEAACSKTLTCGHPCGGVRGEPECLPCLRCPKAEAPLKEAGEKDGEKDASVTALNNRRRAFETRQKMKAPFPAGTDPCCVCYVDELKAEPCIALGCGHVLHRRCALERIENGWPTQNITFEHLRCPLCGEDGRELNAVGSMQAAVMSHPSLARALAPALALRETVMRRARRRLALDANGPPRQIQAGGDYEGRPGEYALSRFNYYLCETCETPYFGGDRACHRGGVERGDDHERGQVPAFGPEAHRLVCGSCSVTSRGKECKKGHGAEEMEYKCRYCCDVAVWFCFGTTHFCDACHTKWVTASPDWETDPPMKACTRKTCPLRVEHPEHGQEFCLGCAVCRSLKASQQE